MAEPIQSHQGAVTSIGGTDLLMCVAPGGGYHPISFDNLMAAVRGGIQIGGRNLIKNSNFANGIGGISLQGGIASLKQSSFENKPIRFGSNALMLTRSAADTYTAPFPIGNLQAGVPYTLTLWGRNAGTIISSSSYVYVDDSALIPIDTRFNVSNGYSKKSVTFTIPKTIADDSLQYRDVKLRIGFRSTSSGWMLIEAMKLEQGTVATDWTPAPEDIASGSWGG